jgi:restriction system protein
MTIPDYQTLMLPILSFSKDRKEHSLKEADDVLARDFQLTESDRNKKQPSGRVTIFRNRISWAKMYMEKAGLLESTRRGCFRITRRGLRELEKSLPFINVRYLKRFPEFLKFKKINPPKNSYSRGNKKP